MTDAELLNKVKTGLSIFDTYHDDILQVHIDNVKAYMIAAGVDSAVVNSPLSVGCILTGVIDLMNYQSGGVKFSDFFYSRLIQLCTDSTDEEGV